MTDERLNKSSGSKFSIDAACPGNQNLIASLSDEQRNAAQPEDPLASRGTRLHAAWQTDSIQGLEDDTEIEDFEKGKRYVESAVAQWAQDNRLETFQEAEREQRFWLHAPDTLAPVLSGQLDRYYTSGSDACLLDFKSGWLKNLIPSHMNWQLRVYAVLLWREHPELRRIRVGFVKPKARADAADYTDYTVDDLEHSEREIFHILWKTRQPDAQRVAGPHCNFCIAKSYCDQAASMSLLPSVVVNQLAYQMPVTKATAALVPSMESIVAKMQPADLLAVWQRSSVIVKILDAIKDRLKGLPEEELKRLGLQLADGRRMDKITKTMECFDYLKAELSMSDEELWSALKMGKTDLVKAFQREFGWAADKAAGYAKQLVQQFGETTQAAKSLERI